MDEIDTYLKAEPEDRAKARHAIKVLVNRELISRNPLIEKRAGHFWNYKTNQWEKNDEAYIKSFN